MDNDTKIITFDDLSSDELELVIGYRLLNDEQITQLEALFEALSKENKEHGAN